MCDFKEAIVEPTQQLRVVFAGQSCFFTRLVPAREFIGQNWLADADNKGAQRRICLGHSNRDSRTGAPVSDEQTVWASFQLQILKLK